MPFLVENHSPFPHFAFLKTGPDGSILGVLAVRATYVWAHGGDMTVAAEQPPVLVADVPDGDPVDGALRLESDLVPGKPDADVLVVGHAHALGGAPREEWIAGIQVGKVSRGLHVMGPRSWRLGAFGYRLTAPRPVDRVSLSYRLAFGGTRRRGDETDAYEQNPVGLGYEGRFGLDDPLWRAPQLEALDARLSSLSDRPAPAGFGPIARSWLPRRARAGSLTPELVRERPGELPDDFDWSFYNSAPPGQIHPGALVGDEWVGTMGLFPEGESVSRLPGYRAMVVVFLENGVPLRLDPRLDTLVIDTDTRLVHATFRLTFPMELQVRRVVLGFSNPPCPPKTARRGERA